MEEDDYAYLELIADGIEMLAALSVIPDRSIRRQIIALAVALRPENIADVIEMFPMPKRRTWPPAL